MPTIADCTARAGGRIQPPGIPDEPCLFFVFLVLGWTWPSLGHADSHVEKAILKPHTVAPSRGFFDETENNAWISP